MNTSHPGTKVGLLDLEINRLAKVSQLTLILKLGAYSMIHIRFFVRSPLLYLLLLSLSMVSEGSGMFMSSGS